MSEAVAVENKPFWKKQRTWAMVLGIASMICGAIPGAQVAAAPLLTLAGFLGFKGFADAQTRIENTVAANAAKLAE